LLYLYGTMPIFAAWRCNVLEERTMDWIYLAMVAGFFAATFGLVYGCEKLRRPS
jgi:hypothetical protein